MNLERLAYSHSTKTSLSVRPLHRGVRGVSCRGCYSTTGQQANQKRASHNDSCSIGSSARIPFCINIFIFKRRVLLLGGYTYSSLSGTRGGKRSRGSDDPGEGKGTFLECFNIDNLYSARAWNCPWDLMGGRWDSRVYSFVPYLVCPQGQHNLQ